MSVKYLSTFKEENQMKKYLYLLLIGAFSVSMLFMGIGCKEEVSIPEKEVVVEEVAEEEVAEEPFPSTISGEVDCISYYTAGVALDAFNEVYENFKEDYPNIELTIIPKSVDEIITVIQTNLVSSDPVDCFFWWADERQQPYVEQGLIAPLTDIFDSTNYDELAPGVYSYSRFRGFGDTPYNVPYNNMTHAMWYNVAKFEEAGIKSAPETWDEFLEVCEKLLDAGIYPLGRNKEPVGHPCFMYLEKFWQRTLPDNSYRVGLKTGDLSADTPEMRKALSYFDELLPYWHPDSISNGYVETYQGFARGDFAMQMMGNWIVGTYEVDMELIPFVDYDMFMFPEIDPNVPKMETGSTNVIVLTTTGKDNKAAQAWVAYWTRPETQKIFCSKMGQLPAIASVEVENPMLAKHLELLIGRELFHEMALPAAIDTDICLLIEERAWGSITTDEFVERWDKIFADFKEVSE